VRIISSAEDWRMVFLYREGADRMIGDLIVLTCQVSPARPRQSFTMPVNIGSAGLDVILVPHDVPPRE
jgi:hypothetical protein